MNSETINSFVSVSPRYQRSVNLSSDWWRDDSMLGYIVTPNVLQTLERIHYGLVKENGQRAYTLTGPYGTGKSAFSVYLCHLLGHDKQNAETAKNVLSSVEPELASKLCNLRGDRNFGFLSIVVTARRRPISQLVLEGLARAVSEMKPSPVVQCLTARIQDALDKDYWKDSATILTFLDQIEKQAVVQGYSGLLLMIDEAGKTLEYALQDRSGGDVFVFQEIAEFANRRKEVPFLFLITLHQMFDDYVELAERTTRAEWGKVQERFQTLQFTESAAATIRILADSIKHKNALPKEILRKIDEAVSAIEQKSIPLPIGMDKPSFQDSANKAWPLHPTVLLAIPYLFKRLAQNERSVFSYLTSHEPYSFQDMIKRKGSLESGFIWLHDVYSYLLSNYETGLARLPQGKRLIEANDIINSRQNLNERQYNLIRSIALMNVLGEICPLRSTRAFLECTFQNEADLSGDLESLRLKSVINFRKLDASYRIWEGSDVDIEERMKDGRRHLQLEGASFLDTLRKYLPEKVYVAKRHSLETGAHRYFTVQFLDRIEREQVYDDMKFPKGVAGSVLVALPLSDSLALQQRAIQATQHHDRLIIALPRQIDALKGVVDEVACLRWVEENTEELRDDRVARRELSLRLVDAEQKLTHLVQSILDPRPAPLGYHCQWFWNGKDQQLKSLADVTRLISHACDRIYFQGPRVRNELIAREKISSAASAARRSLLEKMLNANQLENMGIEGFPPERSIYESVLHSSEIHFFNESQKTWALQAPPDDNPLCLKPCWTLLERKVFTTEPKKIQLKTLFGELSDPPFGLAEGIHPILFTAFYLVNQDDLFLYREGSFIPNPELAHFELMQRRPDLFEVSGARLEGIRRIVVERLAKGLGTPPKTASVVKALFRIMNALPPITLKTTRFADDEVCALRELFLQARSPEDLLFSQIPNLFGMDAFYGVENRVDEIDRFFERLNNGLHVLRDHARLELERARDVLLSCCHIPSEVKGWEELERRALWLKTRVNHEVITPFIVSVINGMADDHNCRPALSFVAKRSFEQWSDLDADRFDGLAEGVGTLFAKSWETFGSSHVLLSAAEEKQKSEMRGYIDKQIAEMKKSISPAALAAALKEILAEIEDPS